MYCRTRHLRFADGPDEAHAQQLARSELKKADAVSWTRQYGSCAILTAVSSQIRQKHLKYKDLEAQMRARL